MKQLLSVFLILALICCLPGCHSSDADGVPTAEDSLRYERGNVHLRADRLEDAAEEYQAIVEQCTATASRMYLRSIDRLAWCKLCLKQQREAMELVLLGDSLSVIAGDKAMQAQFHFCNGRYIAFDNVTLGCRYMREGIDEHKLNFQTAKKDKAERAFLASLLFNDYANLLFYMTDYSVEERLAVYEEQDQMLEKCMEEEVLDEEALLPIRSRINDAKFWFNIHCGNKEDARRLFETIKENLDETRNYDRHVLASGLLALNELDEAKPLMEELYQDYQASGDTLDLNENYSALLAALADMYRMLGDSKKAEAFDVEFRRVSDCITIHRAHQQIDRLSTQYEVQQRQSALEKEMLAHRNSLRLNIALGALLITIVVVLIMVAHVSRIMRKKNAVLAQHIDRLLDEKARNKPLIVKVQPQQEGEPDDSMSDDGVMVERFIQVLIEEQRFCNPDFDREALLSDLHIQRRGFGQLFEQHTGTTIQQYVLNLRLEHAADLIRRRPNYTIDSIALDSGFSSRSTFYRHFTRQFGITPTEYRTSISDADRMDL